MSKAINDSKETRRGRVIDVLNKARAMELTAISQYMNQHYALDDMDYGVLAGNMKLIAIDEMYHAELFAERIKDLGGEPISLADAKVKTDQTVEQIYPFAANMEDNTIDTYNKFLLVCRENGDNVSARLLEDIIVEEQAHQNYFEDIRDHINSLGANYLSNLAGSASPSGPRSKGFVNFEG